MAHGVGIEPTQQVLEARSPYPWNMAVGMIDFNFFYLNSL
jgi:hypothetical protein